MTEAAWRIVNGDSLEVLKRLPDESISAVVTDPPYGLSNTDPKHVTETLVKWTSGDRSYVPEVKGGGFMGKDWDSFVPPPALWDECFRVLKPGGYLLVFAGSRTVDLMTLGVRLANFDIRDSIAWLYGSGFPKCQDLSNLMEKMGEDGSDWQGWNTGALKPAHEPIVVGRKPFKGTVARNVLEHGTGGFNVDATRIATEGEVNPSIARRKGATNHLQGGKPGIHKEHREQGLMVSYTSPERFSEDRAGEALGRYPANVVLTHHEACADDCVEGCPVVTVDEQFKGASRFFYTAKPSKKERPAVEVEGKKIVHPTVKPLAMMRWLVRLVTPPDGIVLDPFAGSGTTLEAAHLEGFSSLGIEVTPEYMPLIEQRMSKHFEEEETA